MTARRSPRRKPPRIEAQYDVVNAGRKRIEAEREFRQAICDAHEGGATMDRIAEDAGLTRQRISQILKAESAS